MGYTGAVLQSEVGDKANLSAATKLAVEQQSFDIKMLISCDHVIHFNYRFNNNTIHHFVQSNFNCSTRALFYIMLL